ncbi:MAG: metallophosphoesterase [Planctomycetota bacterium]
MAFAAVAMPSLVAAHEGHDHGDDHAHQPTPGVAFGEQTLPEGMLLPQAKGPRPWTDKPVLNDENRFQIGIVTDRTGGHRPGIWMDAMRKINLLRPEFVMSVGDLIEGYTGDQAQVEREWKEFLGFVDQLDMRFFFVAGNHDLTNPMMHKVWREKFGDAWYSFDYRGVHFVCLCSEDPVSRIGEGQLGWLRDDLEKSKDARWTLVFLHKPLWTYAERAATAGNEDKTNWKRVEALLAGRPHTVFAGHVHHYVQYERNGGMQYYSFATTGGGSRLRGEDYGEFDHVTWLTMEEDGPRLAVLRLDGILPPGVVTEQSIARFRKFLETARVDVAPILLDNDAGFTGGDINLRLTNEFGEMVRAECEIEGLPLTGLTVEGGELALEVGPTGTAEKAMRVAFAESIDFSRLSATSLTAKLSTMGDDPLRAEVTVPVVIDRRYNCPLVAAMPTIDGQAEMIDDAVYSTPSEPLLIGDAEAWTGAADGSFAFSTAHDGERLYFAFRVTDERLVKGDRLELRIDGRRVERRAQSPRLGWGSVRVVARAPWDTADQVVAGGDGAKLDDYARWGTRGDEPVDGAEIKVSPADGGYQVEVSLPKEVVATRQGDDWHSFQMAVIQHDVDEPDGPQAGVLWRGSPEVTRSNRGYGYFVRGE